MKPKSVSDFVSIEETNLGPAVVVWSSEGMPTEIKVFASRGDAELMVMQIRNALATWPGWQRASAAAYHKANPISG